MYPVYTASAYASNGLFRALVGGAFPLFSSQMFRKLTIQGGCSLLGGLAVLLLPITLTFYLYGARLRAKSRMAGMGAAQPLDKQMECAGNLDGPKSDESHLSDSDIKTHSDKSIPA